MIEIAAKGPGLQVSIDPPVPGIAKVERFPGFSEAVGYAVTMGGLHGREVVDRTGKLSRGELALLMLAAVASPAVQGELTKGAS